MSGLTPARLYNVSVHHTTLVGEGVSQAVLQPWTSPLSSPTAANTVQVTSHSARLVWSPPDVLGTITINDTLVWTMDNVTYRITIGNRKFIR